MPTLETSGLDEFVLALDEIAEIPDSVMESMLNAAGDVLAEAQKKKGRAYGICQREGGGKMLDSIKKRKPGRTADGGYIRVGFAGGRVRTHNKRKTKPATVSYASNAEIAFYNEYGLPGRGIPARPFIRDANDESTGEAVKAAADIYYDWLESKNL